MVRQNTHYLSMRSLWCDENFLLRPDMSATITARDRMSRQSKLLDPVLTWDGGPALRQTTEGRLVSPRGPGQVVLEDRPDISATPDTRGNLPTVRGARRRTNLNDLISRGTITKRQHDAVIRFLDDCSLASGGGLVANMLGVPSSPSPRAGLPEAQVSAIVRVRQVFHLLGLNSGTVFWCVVFEDWTLTAYDQRFRHRKGTGAEWFRAACTALDEHYDDNPRGRKDENT